MAKKNVEPTYLSKDEAIADIPAGSTLGVDALTNDKGKDLVERLQEASKDIQEPSKGGAFGGPRGEQRDTLAVELVEAGLTYYHSLARPVDKVSLASRLIQGETVTLDTDQRISIMDGTMASIKCPFCSGIHGAPRQGKAVSSTDVEEWKTVSNAAKDAGQPELNLKQNLLFYVKESVAGFEPGQLFSISKSCLNRFKKDKEGHIIDLWKQIGNVSKIQGLFTVIKGAR